MVGTATYDFTGETAIVTGSTKGIGRGIAKGFVDAGANVVVNSRTAEDVERAATELIERADGDNRVVGIAGDMSDPDDIDQLIHETIDTFGEVSVLVNNAAVWPASDIDEGTLDDWDDGIDVNARGPYYACRRVIDHWRDRDVHGAIVNVTSQAGERHGGSHGLYGVSKAAQNGLTWRLAHAVAGNDVRVNAVSTAITEGSGILSNVEESLEEENPAEETVYEEMDEWASHIPMGRAGRVEDIADGVLFLASDRAAYVTGHILRVSGGAQLQ